MIKIWIARNDITCVTQEAFVYVANTGLILSGGTGAAIYRRGGQIVQDECRLLGKQKHGYAVYTSAGKLPATYIIHAVGMGYVHENIPKLLYDLTVNCLQLASDLKLKSIVFPAFTCGRMKNPPDLICENMGKALNEYDFSESIISEIGFVLKSDDLYSEFENSLPQCIVDNLELEFTSEKPEILELPWKL